jgi:opacity protein-like surface antigen
MKKLLCTSLVALSVVASGAAFGAPSTAAKAKKTGFYVRGDVGGGSFKSEDMAKAKIGPVAGIGVGYKFDDMFRADIIGQYRSFKVSADTITFSTYALLANGYLDISNSTQFTPYLTAGLGVSHNILSGVPQYNGDMKGTNYPWQVGTGVRMKLSDDIDADLGYRYANYIGKLKLGNATVLAESRDNKDLGSHQILLGVAYNF